MGQDFPEEFMSNYTHDIFNTNPINEIQHI